MANPFQNLNAPAAKKMATEISNKQTLLWVGVALIVHVVIIGATSFSYMQDHWFDPAGAQARADARKAAAAAATPAKPSATQPATLPAAQANKTATPPDDEKALLEKNKNNPVIKGITETAKPNEIPKTPSRTGFNLDDSLK